MVLCDDFHGKVVLLHLNVGTVAHCLHKSSLYFRSRIVGVVQNSEFRVPAFAVQVELSVLLLVEVHAPVHELLDLLGCVFHHLVHGCRVADIVAGYHGVLNVFLEVVHLQVGHRSHAALGKRSVGFVERSLANEANLAFVCPGYLQGVAHAGHSGTDDEKVVFEYHLCCLYSNASRPVSAKPWQR